MRKTQSMVVRFLIHLNALQITTSVVDDNTYNGIGRGF
jgi:hypothetical protein